jgi:hypothetical protein
MSGVLIYANIFLGMGGSFKSVGMDAFFRASRGPSLQRGLKDSIHDMKISRSSNN